MGRIQLARESLYGKLEIIGQYLHIIFTVKKPKQIELINHLQ